MTNQVSKDMTALTNAASPPVRVRGLVAGTLDAGASACAGQPLDVARVPATRPSGSPRSGCGVAPAEPPARLLAEVAARLRRVCGATSDAVFAATVYDVAAFKCRWAARSPA
ncbi:hypothetical protein tb265_49500 [Gemmatimonadetes bacterium T265]|nr:hypothetical protein tb265_49500 [Gemmatimonadetes bacterium T265]